MINKQIKLVALDMDGTLLDSQKRLPKDFIPWVRKHPQIKIVIASGRQYYTLRDDFPGIADELIFIAENGGLVYEQDKIIYSNAMSYSNVKLVLDMVKEDPTIVPIVCGAQSAYMQPTEPSIEAQSDIYYHHMEHVKDIYTAAQKDLIVKIALYVKNREAERVYKSLVMPNRNILPVLSGTDWVDIANVSVSKGAAVQSIQARFGFTPEDCMCFGDYLNDYTLIKSCTESYCMANGHADLKAIAKYQTLSNDEDGVMVVLRQL